jgi:hypothetical protein
MTPNNADVFYGVFDVFCRIVYSTVLNSLNFEMKTSVELKKRNFTIRLPGSPWRPTLLWSMKETMAYELNDAPLWNLVSLKFQAPPLGAGTAEAYCNPGAGSTRTSICKNYVICNT